MTRNTSFYKDQIKAAHLQTQKGVEGVIKDLGPALVGLVAGALTEQPWVGKVAQQLSDLVAEPVSKALASALTSDKWRKVTDQPRHGLRQWLMSDNPDSIAKKIQDVLTKASNKTGVNFFALCTGELPPSVEMAFWDKASKLSGHKSITDLLTQGVNAQEAKNLLVPIMQEVIGEHGKDEGVKQLLNQVADGVIQKISTAISAPQVDPDKENKSNFRP